MEKKELRKFGLILGTVLAGWGAWWLQTGIGISIYFLVAAWLLLLSALFYPLGLKPIYRLSIKLGSILGWTTTRIILVLIFYFIITPIGWWLRLTGKDLLQLKTQKQTKSYWRVAVGRMDKNQLLKQY
ncbi:MAG: hypothetical protein COU72_02425 [Parcubacteria group bacterium CG10_big_fil_rev_8_21_14_0_10_41_35]|nr:MAG: hypothetical protein COU72_02425 [Parcubacteria group bacterium CG10_big_fil_rev_8_21_14_0_10_41_35]